MSLINKLERRFGRFAIPNLTALLVIGQAAMYVIGLVGRRISFEGVALVPGKVLEGEVWRLITFLFYPPGVGPLFAIFYFMLFYLFGNSLEQRWGAFRYNVFLAVGYAANVAAAFAAYGILQAQAGVPGIGFVDIGVPASNTFLYGTVFLSFARFYPDFTLNLYFLLPIRIKWLALLMWIWYGYGLLTSLVDGLWMAALTIVASVANYILFFGREHWSELKHGHRRRSFQVKTKKTIAKPRHECRVCGLNSVDSPRTLFRYCSKCAGQECYCPDHIRDHEHVETREPAGREA